MLNAEISRLYGNPEDFRQDILSKLTYGISKRKLAARAGLCYTHVLKVLAGDIVPQLQTMLTLDEALEQLVNDLEEEND